MIRRGGSARRLRLVLTAIAAQAHASGALARAPEEWAAQLHRLGLGTGSAALSVGSWRRDQRLTAPEAWREALTGKAQELMTRYAVDAAVLEVQHGARPADRWQAGRLAAEQADLRPGHEEVTGR